MFHRAITITWKLYLSTILIILSDLIVLAQQNAHKPNILIIMADDMGFDDVSFRGSNEFLTPNIDALAYSGVILQNLYTPAMCTPSRAALLTGKYPINTGMQHYVIPNEQPWGLPLNETTMAQLFKENGYLTSLLGKWHLGMSRKAYTPTMRGFQQHYGYLGSYIDYYDHTLYSLLKNYTRGHDFRDDLNISHNCVGTYVTDVLTDAAVKLINAQNATEKPLFLILSHLAPHAGNDDNPLQAPEEEIKKFSYIENVERRTYAAMMAMLDKSVGQVINALSESGILNDTIILFYSDNGGPTRGQHATTASNYPLRGQKNSPWEGGIRSSAAIWSTQFEKLSTVWKQKIYVADFLPTLAAAAGLELASLKLDGLNLWPALKYGYESLEREIVHNIDEIYNYVAYTKGKWKFINGTTLNGDNDDWYGRRPTNDTPLAQHYEQLIRNTSVWQQLNAFNDNSVLINITQLRENSSIMCQFDDATTGAACAPLEAACLFDIDADPCEQNNLYEQHKNSRMLLQMLERIELFRKNVLKPQNKPADPKCNPLFYNNEWTWWEDIASRSHKRGSLNYINFIIISSIILWRSIY